jgi:hypothetical protein
MAQIIGNKQLKELNKRTQNNMALFLLHSNKEIKKEF